MNSVLAWFRREFPVRRPRAFPVLPALLAAGSMFLGSSCMSDGEPSVTDGPSTETGNPNIQGTLRDAQGNPSAGAVKLYRVAVKAPSDSMDLSALVRPTLLKTFAAGSDGKFRFDSLPAARYALEGADAAGQNVGLVPGLLLQTAKDTLKRNVTVAPPARLTGRVTRGPNALPAGVTGNGGILVRMGGVDRSAYSDTAGFYSLEQVPAGVYRIAYAAPDGNYEPKFLDSVKVDPGANQPLPTVELDWSRFQAPPAPAGLTMSVDTAGGTIRLAWRAVKLANLDHYEVSRKDSLDPANDRVFLVTGTEVTDTVKALPAGRVLVYQVVTVNALGNRSLADASPMDSGFVPVRPDTTRQAGILAGVVLGGPDPMADVKVRLYAIPATPPPPEILVTTPVALDSALTAADGRYRFAALPAGLYTVTAAKLDWAAIRIGLVPRGESARLDTLRPSATGLVGGKATRDSIWVTTQPKGDFGILVQLAGTPYATVTDFALAFAGGPFILKGVPPGDYKLVVQAPPAGYFLPDTLEVKVVPGKDTVLPALIRARYNPKALPPKINSLKITASTRASVSLGWNPVPASYADLGGYRVLRLDKDKRKLDSSGILTSASYQDDISALASGTQVFYAVKVVNKLGVEGGNGGDADAQPIPFTVP